MRCVASAGGCASGRTGGAPNVGCGGGLTTDAGVLLDEAAGGVDVRCRRQHRFDASLDAPA